MTNKSTQALLKSAQTHLNRIAGKIAAIEAKSKARIATVEKKTEVKTAALKAEAKILRSQIDSLSKHVVIN